VATWDKGRAAFRCRQCGAFYQCTYEDLPSRVQGEQFCEDCGALVHAWVGSRDYDDWKIVRIRPPDTGCWTKATISPKFQAVIFALRASSHAFAYFHET